MAGLVVFLTEVFFGTSVARAADPGEIEALIRKGVELRRAGNDHRALPVFKEAYDLSPTPRTAAQLGLVEMALGYQLDAERHLAEGLASPRDFWIRKNRKTLEHSLEIVQATIGEIAIQGTPRGADVLVNGRSVGQLPMNTPIRVGEGPSTVEVHAPGYVAETLSIKVIGAKREEVAVHLHRVAYKPKVTALSAEAQANVEAPSGSADEPQGPSSKKLARLRAPDVDPSNDGASNHSDALRPVAWIAAAAAAAAAGFGVYETVIWRNNRDKFDRVTTPSASDPTRLVAACGTDEANRGNDPACQTLFTQMDRARTFAIIGYAVSGGMVIGSTILFLMSRADSSESGPRTAMVCAPVGGLTGITCGLSF